MMTKELWKDICDKVEKNNDMDWEDIIEKYDLGVSRDTIRKAVTTKELGAYDMANFLTEEYSKNSQDDRFGEQVREIQMLKIQLQDEKRINSQYMRPRARHERLLETIKEAIVNLKPLEVKEVPRATDGREASLLISDTHYGIVCDNYWNKFNSGIAEERFAKLYNDVLYYCKTMNVTTLHIEILGDIISGYIHQTLRLENEFDVVQQSVRVSELLATLVNKLSNEIENVKVYMTVGNHSRMSPDKKESLDKENFEYFVWEFLKLRLEKVKSNAKMVENDIDETFIHYTIGDEHIFGVHGHMDRVGKVARDFATMFSGKKIKSIHMGHLHHEYTNDDNNIKVVMNGSMSGIDTYSKNNRYTNKPSQTLLVYDGDSTINFNIVL